MGQSKIVVFRHLSRGNEEQAQAANKEFERCYAQLVADGQCSPIPHAEDVITSFRSRGIKDETARDILLGAFTSGTLESMQLEGIRDYCEGLVAEWFARRKQSEAA